MQSTGRYRERWVLAATILASGMGFLEGSVVSVALPSIQHSLSATIAGLQWVVNAYLLTLASLLCTSGSLAGRFGIKRVFIAGIVVFVLGTGLSGAARQIGTLVGFRALQGIGAALMVPGSLAIINVTFPEERRGRAIGLWAGLSGGIAALGPFLGGWLTQYAGWPWVFLVNVPIGLFTLAIAFWALPDIPPHRRGRLDWAGTVLLVGALAGISWGLVEGPSRGWTGFAPLASLAAGVAALLCFFLVERQAEDPIVPPNLFASPLVGGSNLVTLVLYFALNGAFFFLVLNFQQVQGFSPLIAGAALLPPIVLITLLTGPAGGLADRIGPRLPMIAGPAIVGVGLGLLCLAGAGTPYLSGFLPGLVLFGCGMALVIPPLTKSALSVPAELSGAASGVNNAVARIAALLAIAVLGAIMVAIFSARLNADVTHSALNAGQQASILEQTGRLGAIQIPQEFGQAASSTARHALNGAFIAGFRVVTGISALLAFAGAVIAAATIHNKARGEAFILPVRGKAGGRWRRT